MSEGIVLHPLGGPPGSRLAGLCGTGLEAVVSMGGPGGCPTPVVGRISGDETVIVNAREGLPEGAALPEGIAARLAADGVPARWGEQVVVRDCPAMLALCRERGRSSVELARADPELLTRLQLGSWFDAPWRTRALRRIPGLARAASLGPLARASPRVFRAVADLAFWAGVRERASGEEWRRLTASSYVALVYHRFAGEMKPGQERIDIAPARFARQLRALRLLGFRPLDAEAMIAFHAGELTALPRGALVITVDDGLADCLGPLRREAAWRPQLFVPTTQVGGSAHWLDGEPLADWEDLRDLATAGVGIGAHARNHQRLTELDEGALREQLSGSRADLRAQLDAPLDLVAYPHGDHDPAVCEAARRAGFSAGLTTEKGRNGAGADRFALRRVSVHGADGVPAVLWKAITGEALPPAWVRLRGMLRPHGSS